MVVRASPRMANEDLMISDNQDSILVRKFCEFFAEGGSLCIVRTA